jgi:hypothetical protein
MNNAPVTILYQALPPPLIDGLRNDAKPGGYSDGGADIAFELQTAGVNLVTPTSSPDPSKALDWVFPDTAEGTRLSVRPWPDLHQLPLWQTVHRSGVGQYRERVDRNYQSHQHR